MRTNADPRRMETWFAPSGVEVTGKCAASCDCCCCACCAATAAKIGSIAAAAAADEDEEEEEAAADAEDDADWWLADPDVELRLARFAGGGDVILSNCWSSSIILALR